MSFNKLLNNQFTFPLLLLLASVIFWVYIINKVNGNNTTQPNETSILSPSSEKIDVATSDEVIKTVEKNTEEKETISLADNNTKVPPPAPKTDITIKKSNLNESKPSTSQLSAIPAGTEIETTIEKKQEKLIKDEPNIVKKPDDNEVESKRNSQINNSFAPFKPTISFENPSEEKVTKKDENTQAPEIKQVMPTKKVVKNNSLSNTQMENIIANLKKQTTPVKNIKSEEKANKKGKESSEAALKITDLQEQIKNLTNRLMKAENKSLENNQTSKSNTASTTKQNNSEYVASLKEQGKVTTLTKQEKDKVDYYNRIQLKNTLTGNTLQDKVYKLTKTSNSSKYVESLKSESKVRRNQVRSIELKKGESIWMIAVRAYGDGNDYVKILKANPQITVENARLLQPGIFIRVPL